MHINIPEKKKCPSCGHEVCPHCGKPIEKEARPYIPPYQPYEPIPWQPHPWSPPRGPWVQLSRVTWDTTTGGTNGI